MASTLPCLPLLYAQILINTMVSKITKRLLRFRNKRAKPSSEVDPATESTNVKEIPAPHLSSHHLLLLPPDSHIHMGAYTVCQCISPRNSDAVIRDSYKIKVQRSQDAEEKVSCSGACIEEFALTQQSHLIVKWRPSFAGSNC